MDNLTIECVWYESKREFNKFVRSVEDPHIGIIDYSIIKNKLIKADPYGKEPKDSIIGLNIVSSIKSQVNIEKKLITSIVYSFKNLNETTVSNFIELVNSKTDRNLTFVLNVLNMKNTPSDSVIDKFDSVNFIEND